MKEQTTNKHFGDPMKAFILALLTFLAIDVAFSQPVPSEAQYQLNQNKLVNPGFEQGRKGWTSAAGTLTATAANGVDDGVNAGCVTLTAQTLDVSQIISVGNLRGQGEVAVEAYATVAGAQVCSVVDNVDVNCSPVENLSAWRNRKEIGFVAGATNYGIRYKSAAPVTGTFCLDSAYAGKIPTGRVSEVGAIGPWISYTPTTQGLGSATISAFYRINGDSIEIDAKVTPGTTNGDEARLGLPSGFVSAGVSRIPTLRQAGVWFVGDSGANKGGAVLIEPNVAYVTFSSRDVFGSSNTNPISKNVGTVTLLANSTVRASIPIAGLSNKTTIYSQQCTKDTDCENVFSAEIASDGAVVSENIDWINGNCTNPSTGVKLCQLNSSLALVNKLTCSATPVLQTGAISTTVRYESSSSPTQLEFISLNGSFTPVNERIMVVCQKQGADYKAKNVIFGAFEDVVKTIGSRTAEVFSFSFGSTNKTTPCTASPCSYLDQLGQAVTSVTRGGTGSYTVNLSKTYSKIKCTSAFPLLVGGQPISSSPTVNVDNVSSFSISVQRSDTGGAVDVYGNFVCHAKP
jgi:hypothetical protein